jgi:hypothetical protein
MSFATVSDIIQRELDRVESEAFLIVHKLGVAGFNFPAGTQRAVRNPRENRLDKDEHLISEG